MLVALYDKLRRWQTCLRQGCLTMIVVNDVRYIKCTDDVSDSLMDAFDDRIGLRVPSCYRFHF